MRPDFAQYGFRHNDNLLLAFVGGSQMHGAKVSDTDDKDWYGVYVEPPELVIGLDKEEHFVFNSGGGKGNGPADLDVTLYGLKKFAGLAAKGNPSILHFFFFKPNKESFQSMDWCKLAMRREIFLAKSHVGAFLGFAKAQSERLFNGRGQKNVHRVALEDKYGYDTKYAMHIIRLYGEAIELMETGKITLPRPNAAHLIDIRLGKFQLYEVKDMALELESKAKAMRDISLLPERVDRAAISALISEIYRDFWQRHHSRI